MPGFLDILGGLATSGAQGATGALTGVAEGEGLRRKYQTEDILNSLHVLQQLSAQQDLAAKQRAAQNPTYHFGPGGEIFQLAPAMGPPGPPTLVPGPPSPLAQLHQAQTEAATARAKWDAARTEQAGKPKPVQYDAKTQAALDEWRGNPENQGKSLMDFWREFSSAQRAPERSLIVPQNASVLPPGATAPTYTAPAAPVTHFGQSTDMRGDLWERVSTINPATGKYDTTLRRVQGPNGQPISHPANAPKEPTSYDALRAISADPTQPPEARSRAQVQADAIDAGHTARTKASVDIRDAVKQAQDQQKLALKNQDADTKRMTVLSDVERMRGMAKEIESAGLLPPTGTTGVGMWIANKKRAWLDPSNDALIAFRGLFGSVIIGEIDRGIFDEKGVRAIQAFKANFDMIDKMPSYSAINRFLTEVEGSIQSKMRSTPANGAAPQAVGGPAYTTPDTGKLPPSGGVIKWGRDASGKPVRLQ